MALVNVLNAVNYNGFSAPEETIIAAAITSTYNNSATARKMYEGWISAGNAISISNIPNVFQAYTDGSGRVEIDIPYISKLYFIDDNGNSVKYPFELALVHEFVHAFERIKDNFDAPSGGYRGDTVVFTNNIHQELGYPNRNSYIGTNFDNVINPNFSYTGGVSIDRSFADDSSWSSTGNPLKGTLFSDDLLIGGASANSLEGNLGNDFLFGGGGDDFLNGGVGGTDTVVLSGKPVDYDIRLNSDGTWTSEHVRGAINEGTDRFQNLERVRFAEMGDTFNLAKSGLTWQTDFAFVIDQTGSMDDDIAAVKNAATGVVNALFANNTIDARIGIVGFRDNTNGEPTSIILPFTDQDDFAARQAAAISAINSISVGGGGDEPETAYDGLLQALNGSMGDWRVGAGVKKVALFTDASAKDAILLPAVLAYALSIGATISSSSSAAFGDVAAIDSFELTFGKSNGIFPGSEGETLPPYVPSGDPIEAPGGSAIVQVITIFIDTFISPDPSFKELADATGGSVEVASNPTEVIDRLLSIITTTNYILTVDRGVVVEGDSGLAQVSFTISRDRTDTASTVSFETIGDALSTDVTGAPTKIDFEAGDAAKTFVVSVVGDTMAEGDKSFGLKIAHISEPASFSSNAVSFVIEDNDKEIILGTDKDDDIFNPLGGQAIFLRGASDTLRGPVESYFDDVVEDFGVDDLIVFEGTSIARRSIDVTNGPAIFDVDTDGDGSANGSFTLEGDYTSGDFMAVSDSGDTYVTFEAFLPELRERQEVDPGLVNGIINQNFLKGDGTTDFKVTLRDLGFAAYNNVVGLYEVDAVGNIIDARVLFNNANADKSAEAVISDVTTGNRLGFFIIQDAADLASTLASEDTLSFVNSSGGAANISDGAEVFIAINDAVVDEVVFHSFNKGMNLDGLQHALSGVDVGGEAITIGFEDLTGGGDRDYEDVVFKVELVDDVLLV